MLKAKLLVVGGDARFGEVKLNLPTTIGRGREAILTLPHPLVSRLHCEIFERDGRLVVKDLESLNGTFVNNQKIVGEEFLEPEQLLTLGNVTFRAVYEVGVSCDPMDESPCAATGEVGNAEFQTVLDPELEPNEKETVYDEKAGSESLASTTDVSEDNHVASLAAAGQLDTIRLDVPASKQSDASSEDSEMEELARKLPR